MVIGLSPRSAGPNFWVILKVDAYGTSRSCGGDGKMVPGRYDEAVPYSRVRMESSGYHQPSCSNRQLLRDGSLRLIR